jgi:hypothetical protein
MNEKELKIAKRLNKEGFIEYGNISPPDEIYSLIKKGLVKSVPLENATFELTSLGYKEIEKISE